MNDDTPCDWTIRTATEADWPGIWRIIEPVIRAGETYPQDPDISEQAMRQAWMDVPTATFVAVSDGAMQPNTADANALRPEAASPDLIPGAGAETLFPGVVGTCYLKPNQPTLGAHVCNAGFIVGEGHRRMGLATAMCEHAQAEARALGFLAMQFNLVVSTNTASIRAWTGCGFAMVGTLPKAFRHKILGLVDAYVMHKALV